MLSVSPIGMLCDCPCFCMYFIFTVGHPSTCNSRSKMVSRTADESSAQIRATNPARAACHTRQPLAV